LKRLLGLEVPFEHLILLGQVRQWCSDLGVVLDKLLVEVRETEEGLDFLHYYRFRLAYDGFDLLRVYLKSFSRYDVSEELDFLLVEFCLFCLNAQICIVQRSQNETHMLDMFLVCFGVYQDVVEVDYYKHVKVLSQDIVDVCLESGWGVREPEWHDQVLEESLSRSERSLPFFAFFHLDSIVRSRNVECGKPLSSLQAVLQLVDQR
jgi:hypothetical protein